MHSVILKLIVISVFVITLLPINIALAAKNPKLVLQITVDALRGDLLGRFNKILGNRGFRYLTEEGVYYQCGYGGNYQLPIYRETTSREVSTMQPLYFS